MCLDRFDVFVWVGKTDGEVIGLGSLVSFSSKGKVKKGKQQCVTKNGDEPSFFSIVVLDSLE